MHSCTLLFLLTYDKKQRNKCVLTTSYQANNRQSSCVWRLFVDISEQNARTVEKSNYGIQRLAC